MKRQPLHKRGMGRWFIAYHRDYALVLQTCCYHETQLKAMGFKYCEHGPFQTRKAAMQRASYMGYGHMSVQVGKLYTLKPGQHLH